MTNDGSFSGCFFALSWGGLHCRNMDMACSRANCYTTGTVLSNCSEVEG